MRNDDRVFIFVNGIRTAPADATAWTDRATAWYLNRGLAATDYEYWSFALTRRIRQQYNARQLALKIDMFGGRVVLVGHSNGCDLILRALALCTSRNVADVFLIGAACDERCDKNGINAFLRTRKVSKFWCFCSEADEALKLAKKSAFLRPFGLGYGWLGLVGPQNKDACEPRIDTEWFKEFKHGDWFEPIHFESTMQFIETATRQYDFAKGDNR